VVRTVSTGAASAVAVVVVIGPDGGKLVCGAGASARCSLVLHDPRASVHVDSDSWLRHGDS